VSGTRWARPNLLDGQGVLPPEERWWRCVWVAGARASLTTRLGSLTSLLDRQRAVGLPEEHRPRGARSGKLSITKAFQ
jgi:hypothetical protein